MPLPARGTVKHRWQWLPAEHPWRGISFIMLTGLLGAVLAFPPTPDGSVAHAQSAAADALVWSIGGPSADEARQLPVDPVGNVYVAGVFTSTVDADPGPGAVTLTSAGDTDIFLAKYAPDGQLAWARAFGGRGEGPGQSSIATAVTMHPLGDVLLTGRFFGTDVDFDPGDGVAMLGSLGQSDGFVVALGPDGALVRR